MISHANKQLARLDPAAVFERPLDVLAAVGLSRREKLEILRRWRYDAIELNVAADEGMAEEPSPLLDRILAAIDAIGPGDDDETTTERRA